MILCHSILRKLSTIGELFLFYVIIDVILLQKQVSGVLFISEHEQDGACTPQSAIGSRNSFIINDKNLAAIRKLKDNNGAYIWQPSYQAGEPDRILGYAVHTSAFAPENALAFGDYSYYNIGDRGTRSFSELRELFAGNGMIGYVAKERVDGRLILPEAVQILRIGSASSGS